MSIKYFLYILFYRAIIVIVELCTFTSFTSCRTNAIWSTGSAKDFTKQIVISLALINKSQTLLPPPPSPFASSPTRDKQLRVLFEGSEAQTSKSVKLNSCCGNFCYFTQEAKQSCQVKSQKILLCSDLICFARASY